jgi:hypothetical protein
MSSGASSSLTTDALCIIHGSLCPWVRIAMHQNL